MARPKKNVIDYFPHDSSHGKTLFILESNWGNDGYAVWFKLLEVLCRSDMHYVDCRDHASLLHLAAYCRVSVETLTGIIDMLASLGAVNQGLWSGNVVFSGGLVDRIADVYRKRSASIPTAESVSAAVNLPLSVVSAPETQVKSAEMPQIKVNKIRVNDIKTETDSLCVEVEEKKSAYSDDFLEFWAAYPLKVAKGEAWKAWKKSKPPVAEILKAIEWQQSSRKWREGYVPNPATYINQRRWEDEPEGGNNARTVGNHTRSHLICNGPETDFLAGY